MATTWIPHNTFEKPRQWLLENGEVVSEPALEQTSSGVKVRVAGTNLSAYSRDIDTLILQAVQEVARKKQTNVWMPLDGTKEAAIQSAGFDPDNTKAELFLLGNDQRTVAWWRFKHPTMPIEAVLYVTAAHQNHYYPQNGQMVKGSLVMPKTLENGMRAAFSAAHTAWFGPLVSEPEQREFIRDNPPPWSPVDILGETNVGGERQMVKVLLDRVRLVEDLDTIQVPDLRSTGPGWLDLELYETNVNATFIADLVDYLEGESTIEEAMRIYNELRACLRGIGMYLNEKSENDFQRALVAGETDYLLAEVAGHPAEDINESNSAQDPYHRLRMHLHTGTFVVDCDHKSRSGEIVDKWEEARTIASLSGQEDELLAYARAYVKTSSDKRAKTILKQRKQ